MSQGRGAVDPHAMHRVMYNMLADFCFAVQAQALIRKSHIYQQIDKALHSLLLFHPNVYHNVPRSTSATLPSLHHHNNNSNNYRYRYHDDDDEDDKVVTSLHRDAAVNNIRLLGIFYGYSPATFALAVNLLDRLLGKVKVRFSFSLNCHLGQVFLVLCLYFAVFARSAFCINALASD